MDDECSVCGVAKRHVHTDLAWDDTWGLVPGENDEIEWCD